MWCVCVTIKFSLRFAATQMTPRILQPSVNKGQCAHRILKILEVCFGSFWTISLAEFQVHCEEESHVSWPVLKSHSFILRVKKSWLENRGLYIILFILFILFKAFHLTQKINKFNLNTATLIPGSRPNHFFFLISAKSRYQRKWRKIRQAERLISR